MRPRRARQVVGSLVIGALLATACTGPGALVSIEPSTTTWETYSYELTRFNTIQAGSYDGETRVNRTFDTWIIENEYLEVTLLPEFGGRILSIIYKPTGHEQLYQNPVGVPYQIGNGVFFFDWLMVYGGIFPTFPEPEHGKTWFVPWDFEIVEETEDRVTVAMTYTDDVDYPLAPRQYDGAATGLKVTYAVTVEAGRAAVDTSVMIENPGTASVEYEYWTNVTLAPGSDPEDPRTTAGAEIIAPVDMITIPAFWSVIAAQEERTGLGEVHHFEELRTFGKWKDRGIAYAFPDMRDSNFWGVINQDRGEGFFRVADNTITPGLKLWTWGYPQTADLDPNAGPDEARPYIEMWAGLTQEFFWPTEIGPGERIEFAETYAPTVGLASVTHASDEFLVDLRVGDPVTGDIMGLQPGSELTATLKIDGEPFHESTFVVKEGSSHSITAPHPDGGSGRIELTLTDPAGAVVFVAGSNPADG